MLHRLVQIKNFQILILSERNFKDIGQITKMFELLQVFVDVNKLPDFIVLETHLLVDFSAKFVDVLHGRSELVEFQFHVFHVCLHFANGVSGADEFVVVFVN